MIGVVKGNTRSSEYSSDVVLTSEVYGGKGLWGISLFSCG